MRTGGASAGAGPAGFGRPAVLALALLTLAALLLRLAGLRESLFGDELFTFDIVSERGLGEVLRRVHDTSITPPLHYVVAWAAVHFGDPTESVRLPSIVFGAAAVPAVYALGLRTVGRPAAFVAAALMALSPFAVYYGQEARAYATLVLLLTGSTLTLLIALDGGRRRWWIAFVALSGAALYAHYTAVFALAPQAAWALWAHRQRLRDVVLAHAAVAAVFAPWIPFYLDQRENFGIEALDALFPLTLRSFSQNVGRLVPGHPLVALGEVPGKPALALLGLGLAIAAAAVVLDRRALPRAVEPPSARLILVLILAAGAPLAEALYSLAVSSIAVPRSLLVAQPALCLALGALVVAPRPRPLRALAVGCLLAVTIAGLVRGSRDENRRLPWREAAAFVDAQAPAAPVVVLDYFGGATRDPLGRAGGAPLLRNLRIYLERSRPALQATPAELARPATLRAADGLLLVVPGFPTLRTLPPPPPELDRRFRLTGRRTWTGAPPIAVLTYVRRAGT